MQLRECNRKAEQAKVLLRERAAHINHCLEAAGK
jgi:hypothetical protein